MNKNFGTLYIEDKGELGVFYENKKLYAGYISNSGVNKNWEIDYDPNFTFDENLVCLVDIIKDNLN